MTVSIPHKELLEWRDKPVRIFSMVWKPDCYVLDYAPVPKPTPKPEPPPLPDPMPVKTPVIEPQEQEKAIVIEVECPDCHAMKPANEPCPLCESLARAATNAKQARRDWARRNRP